MATSPWFFAAARIIAGPPMSMFSTHVSKSAPDATRRQKRVEVDDDEVDQRDAVLRQGRHVRRVVAPGQDAAMDLRLQRLDPPIQDLRLAGERRHVQDLEPGRPQCLGRPAGRDQRHAMAGQRLSELDQAGLVGGGKERPGRAEQRHGQPSGW
jgi:hypothetical protein